MFNSKIEWWLKPKATAIVAFALSEFNDVPRVER